LIDPRLGRSGGVGVGVGVLEANGLAAWVAGHRHAGRQIVLTNGCFDLLHVGHVAYLQQARRQGDVLIVGLNSDASVRRLKGPGRPVISQGDRARVLAGLGCVDRVVLFDEDTPGRLITAVRPDWYVKGGDYDARALPERELVESTGGRVAVLEYLPGHSTSELIARIRGDQIRPGV
jgi:rfaE bifunctional protein nucleotidyltransferase chain/domain